MDWIGALTVAIALVAATTGIGLWLRSRDGRITTSSSGADVVVSPADVDSADRFGEQATLLQFSTEFCARCPQTRTLLGGIADVTPGVRHLDIDLTHRPDIAKRFSVLQTPTTLLLDSRGVVRARIGGAPDRTTLSSHLLTIIGSRP
ncbi:MAG: thioredoxin family protein [Leifsonia sp.]